MAAELTPAQTSITPGGRFRYEVHNLGDQWLFFGEAYALERQRDDAWEPCPCRVIFRAWAANLPPGGRRELMAYVPDSAPPGHYRLVKEMCEKPDCYAKLTRRDPLITASFEFDVTAG